MAICCDLEVDVNGQWSRDFHGDEPNEEEIVHAQPKTKQPKKLFGQRKKVLHSKVLEAKWTIAVFKSD